MSWQERLQHEYYEVRVRVGRLERFISSDDFKALPDIDKHDLVAQLGYMQDYRRILMRRVKRLEDESTKHGH